MNDRYAQIFEIRRESYISRYHQRFSVIISFQMYSIKSTKAKRYKKLLSRPCRIILSTKSSIIFFNRLKNLLSFETFVSNIISHIILKIFKNIIKFKWMNENQMNENI